MNSRVLLYSSAALLAVLLGKLALTVMDWPFQQVISALGRAAR